MYRTFKITTSWLESNLACKSGIARFKELFPRGLTISNSQEEMSELFVNIAFAYDDYEFIKWLVVHVNSLPGDTYIGLDPFGRMFNGNTSYCNIEFHITDVANLSVLLSDSPLLS